MEQFSKCNLFLNVFSVVAKVKIHQSSCFLASQLKILLCFSFPKTELAVLIRHKAYFTLRAHFTVSCQIIEDIVHLRMKALMIQLPLSGTPHLFSGLQYRCEYYFMYRSWVHYLKSWQIRKEKGYGLMKTKNLKNVGRWLLSFRGRWLWLSIGSCTISMIMQSKIDWWEN